MRLYGNLVAAICSLTALPLFGWVWLQDPAYLGGREVILALILNSVVCYLSYRYLKDSSELVVLSCISDSALLACMHLYRFPFKLADPSLVLPHFLWALLIICGNIDLPFRYKAGLSLIPFTTTLLVIDQTPALILGDSLPLLLGATTLHVLFNFFIEKEQSQISPHGISFILAGTFAYHFVNEVKMMLNSPENAVEGAFSILMAAFFGIVGFASSGAFRNEIDKKETLELLVQERTKEIMQQAEQLRVVEHALQASETAIAITDSDQRVLWSNSALEQLTSMRASELTGSSLLLGLGMSMSDKMNKDVRNWFSNTSSTENEIIIRGANICVEISPFPSKRTDDAEKVCAKEDSRFLVVLKDITVQKARDKAETDAMREAMKSQAAEESMQTLSHELRTPLQGILGMASLMLDDASVPKLIASSLNVIMTSARLLLTLINNILDIRKCDSMMMDEFHLAALDLSTALANSVDFCKPFAGISGVSLNGDEITNNLYVKSNALRFQQIMINLISNSIKYSPAGSSVKISVEIFTLEEAGKAVSCALAAGPKELVHSTSLYQCSSNVAVISVSDSGAGIPEGQRTQIFGKFAQLDTRPSNTVGGETSAQPSGTGLGLNLCLKFVNRMNGRIWANNNDNGGSTFSFYLPLMMNEDEVSKALSARSSEKRKSSTLAAVSEGITKTLRADKYQVLVVDDTIINLKVLERMLHRIGVRKVTCVSSGAQALGELEKGEYNLVLTDIQMPGMSGIELANAILNNNTTRYARPLVVGLTAEVSELTEEQCLHVGMKKVLHKPITATQVRHFLASMESKLSIDVMQ